MLTDEEQAILQDERHELVALRDSLAALDATRDDLAVLDRARQQLDELFLLVIVGEFNSGKSAFINALLGQRFLVEGVTPTTTQVHLLKYGAEASQLQAEQDLAVMTFPAEWLVDLNIVDTPGTNAIIVRHQEITEEFVPRADLILFVTSADRPFTESERAFMERIREWGKKVVVVVNKIDILETPEDVDHVVDFVAKNAVALLGREPTIFPVAARLARRAKELPEGEERTALWAASRFEPLESYILRTLDERERVRLKLASPIGVAGRLGERYLGLARQRRDLLADDVAAIANIRDSLAGHETDMRREFKYHLSHIDNVLYRMTERGDRFFDETIRLARILDLINAERVRGMFEREVVADTSAEIDSQTHDLIDWLVDQDYREWQAVMEYINRRIVQHEQQIVGQVGGQFEFNRQALLESVGRAARDTVSSYDKQAEARDLAESVQVAVAQTALVEVGAIGLGALLVKVLATTLADVSGVLAASAVAALGLYLIPRKRRKAQEDLHAKVADLRDRMGEAITAQFSTELDRSLARIRTAISPYTRFVDAQTATVQATIEALEHGQQRLQDLDERIEGLTAARG